MGWHFAWLPPEINSARIFAGAGSGPLHVAAVAWEGLAADLATSASAFDAVIAGLAGGPWTGPASVSMAAAAAPYVGWLSAAAAQAETAATQARAAATVFETALAATVHPATVTANRVLLGALVATNFLGQNTPAIAGTEFDYAEMWAQDVGAMVGYDAGAAAAASTLAPFVVPPLDLAGIAAQASTAATAVSAAVSPALQGVVALIPGVATGVQSMVSALPVSSVMQAAQFAATPAGMVIGPLLQLGQSASAGTAGWAGAAGAGELAEVPRFVGDANPMKGLGGAGAGLGAGMSADLGKARLVGAMSVPPTWEGSLPRGLSSAALAGLGTVPNAAELAAMQGGGTGGMPMMPMPMGAGGAGAGMPAGMGRGGATPHVTQSRPSVIPRTGIG
ncbi:PPE family protein [Mycobacterium attenuatum]|uniref:PPE family protein n=1 Tax=Mycobacterium attenuatum TaxID=2341086 RepID=UPI000F034652|nr:PPE family protein [Mycobacterium attenuatum]VBA61856.1 putative PPE family protein PPE38 [Mycobacterium attenuatum]